MPDVKAFIQEYGIKSFKLLSPRDQNKLLYNKWPKTAKTTLRTAKTKFLDSLFLAKKAPSSDDLVPKIDEKTRYDTTIQSKKLATNHENTLLNHKQLDILPDSLKKLLVMAPYLKDVPSWMGPLIIEEIRKDHRQDAENLIIKRPSVFHKKQNELVDAIIDPKIRVVFCPGAQRSGKSTGVMEGLHELSLMTNRAYKILLLAGKGGQDGRDGGARGILADLLRDPFLEENNNKLLDVKRTNSQVTWSRNGQTLTATDLTVAAIKGGDQDYVWIDEMDVAIKKGKEQREAIVSAVNTMLAVPHFKLICTANLDKGLYQILADRIKEEGLGMESMKIIEIFRSDCPHLENKEVAENYQIARIFTEVLLSDAMAQMRLEGEMSYEGDIFDQQSIKDAYAIYDSLINTSFDNPEEFWLETEYNVLAIDPSGEGHPWGYFIGGVNNNYFIEIESGELQMGTPQAMGGGKWTPDRLNMKTYTLIKKYNIKFVVIESNTGGPGLKIYLDGKGVKNIEYQNFGAEGNYNARGNYLKVVNKILYARALALKNRRLHPQLTVYDPDDRRKTSSQVSQKGDLADAFIHYCWKASGGLEYISKEKPALKQKVRIL